MDPFQSPYSDRFVEPVRCLVGAGGGCSEGFERLFWLRDVDTLCGHNQHDRFAGTRFGWLTHAYAGTPYVCGCTASRWVGPAKVFGRVASGEGSTLERGVGMDRVAA